jgi:hypothetical protein
VRVFPICGEFLRECLGVAEVIRVLHLRVDSRPVGVDSRSVGVDSWGHRGSIHGDTGG